jgi:DNA-binding response OmpR family regulator
MSQVLLAEDGAAISIALEDALADGGYTVAGPFATGSAALAWLRNGTPDLALLDLTLGDGLCFELARTLQHRGVPILVLSGAHRAEADLPAELGDVTWLEKPASFERLMECLGGLATTGHVRHAASPNQPASSQ